MFRGRNLDQSHLGIGGTYQTLLEAKINSFAGADLPATVAARKALEIMKRALFLLAALAFPFSSQAVDEETKATPEFKEMMTKGQAVYQKICFACHQNDGSGKPAGSPVPLAPPLTGSDWLNDDDRIIRVVLRGLSGEITVGDVTMTGVMPPAHMLLTDKEIAQVLSFVRNNWGNEGKLISPRRMAQIREATKARQIPYTVKEILEAHPLKEEE